MNKKFVPFCDLTLYQKVIVVGGYHPDAMVLSHWKGVSKIEGIGADTSTEIVLNALEKGFPDLEHYPYVTNSHFDIDSFLGLWSLCFPAAAQAHSLLLRKMAQIANFRELELNTAEDHVALRLVCWINTVEKARFYVPFALTEPGKDETRGCVRKFEFFLGQFANALQNPDDFRHDWQHEYDQVIRDLQIMEGPHTSISLQKDIRLMVVQTPEPLHYYALFARSKPADMVLSIYHHNRYELEYKYTTWIDTANRAGYPRIDLQPLANLLNRHEETEHSWTCERITDTSPLLHLGHTNLTKAQRFDHPYNREIFSSSIPTRKLIALMSDYYEKAYRNLDKKASWTWPETREINHRLRHLS